MSRKYTESALRASAKPEPNSASSTPTNRVSGIHGKQRAAGDQQHDTQQSELDEELHAGVQHVGEHEDLAGNATRRTRPALAEIAPMPRLFMSEKKFHGISPQSMNRAKFSRSLGSPFGGVASNNTPNTNP